MAECLTCKDDTFPQLLLLAEYSHGAAEKVHQAAAVVASSDGQKALKRKTAEKGEIGSGV